MNRLISKILPLCLVFLAIVSVISGCVTLPVDGDAGFSNVPREYYDSYPKASADANILLTLQSNQQRTTFYVDGKPMATGRNVKVLINGRAHTVIASPEGYYSKEEFIQPPYLNDALLSFTFLLEHKRPGYKIVQPPFTPPDVPPDTSEPAPPLEKPTEPIEPKILPTKRRSQYAVIVGISQYRFADGENLTNLSFADKDAENFAVMLTDLGWRQSNIKLIVNQEATKRNIEIALDSWLTKAHHEDIIVIFWSGHGYPDPVDPNKIYFACHDTDIRVPATGFRMDRVRNSVEERKARHVIFLADTCHAGKLITRGVDKGFDVGRGIKSSPIPDGTIFMVGAESDRNGIEHSSWSNGAFTHCLLEGLAGKADGFLSSGAKDDIVTMGELRTYLEDVMPSETLKVLGTAMRPTVLTNAGAPEIWNLSLKP